MSARVSLRMLNFVDILRRIHNVGILARLTYDVTLSRNETSLALLGLKASPYSVDSGELVTLHSLTRVFNFRIHLL